MCIRTPRWNGRNRTLFLVLGPRPLSSALLSPQCRCCRSPAAGLCPYRPPRRRLLCAISRRSKPTAERTSAAFMTLLLQWLKHHQLRRYPSLDWSFFSFPESGSKCRLTSTNRLRVSRSVWYANGLPVSLRPAAPMFSRSRSNLCRVFCRVG